MGTRGWGPDLGLILGPGETGIGERDLGNGNREGSMKQKSQLPSAPAGMSGAWPGAGAAGAVAAALSRRHRSHPVAADVSAGAAEQVRSPAPPRAHRLAIASLAAVVLAASGIASRDAEAGHNVFHIFAPAIEAEHQGFEVLSAFYFGLPKEAGHEPGEEEDHGHAHGSIRAAHEIAYHRAVNEHWMSKLALAVDREAGGDYELTGIASENMFRLGPARSDAFDFGWFTALSAGLASGATNAVEFGPVVSLSAGAATLVLNPFFEKTFGDNREEGIAFAYAWRASYELAERFSVGVEGYGEIENIGDAPGVGEQVHRIGPVLYLGHLHGATRHAHAAGGHGGHTHHGQAHHGDEQGLGRGAPQWHAEIGVLFGLTEATADAALKVNIGADF